MKSLMTLGLAILVSAPVFAQKTSDITRLTKQKDKTLQALEATAVHFNQDMSAKFACFPDYQMPYDALKVSALEKIETAKVATETTFNLLLDGAQDNGLKAMVEDLNKYKEIKRKEKNRYRRQSLKKIIAQKKQQITDMATLIVRDSSDGYKSLLRDTVTLGGLTKIAMKENASNISVVNIFKEVESISRVDGRSMSDIYNEDLAGLMDSCTTASCVYLVTGDVKQWIKDSMKLNKDIKLISQKTIAALNSYSLKKIFKKLDEVSAEIARKKPIGDVSDECIPAPQPVPGDDDTNANTDSDLG